MKCNQSRPGFELVSPCPFPTTITITPRASPTRCNSYWKRNLRVNLDYDRPTTIYIILYTRALIYVYIDIRSITRNQFFIWILVKFLFPIYAHIFSVYTKMRLFKSQKTRGDREKTIYKFEFSTSKLTKNNYPHSYLRPKMYFCKPV